MISRLSPRRRWLYSLGLSIGLALFGYQVWRAAQATQYTAYCIQRPLQLTVVLAINITCSILQIAAWYGIMYHLSVTLPIRQAVKGYILSFLPRYIPGTVWGYLSRSEWLAQSHQVPYATSAVASLLEVILQLSSVLILSVLHWVPQPWRWLLAIASLLLTVVTWSVLPAVLARWGPPRLSFSAITRRKPLVLALSFALYVLFWNLHGLALSAIAATLCQPLLLPWWPAAAYMGGAWAVGFLTLITPTGLGVRELSLAAFLRSQGGISVGPAALIAVLSRGLLLAAELVLILCVLPLHLWQRRAHP